MLVDALQSLVTTDPTLAALLGSPASRPDSTNGVFPVQAPDQPSMPFLVYSQVSGEPLSVTYEGTGRLTEERWRFSCYGTTYRNAKKFAKTLRLFLLNVKPSAAIAGISRWFGAYCVMEADEAESIGRGTLFSSHIDFNIVYDDNDTSA